MSDEKKVRERIYVKAFGKYLDELTVEEWEQMANASCGLPDKPGAKEPENELPEDPEDLNNC